MTLLQLGIYAIAILYVVAIVLLIILLYQAIKNRRSKSPGPDIKNVSDYREPDKTFPCQGALQVDDANFEQRLSALGIETKEAQPIIIDSSDSDIKPLYGKSKQNKENRYKASKCCGVMTEVPKQGVARCSKCNKFTSLL